MMLLAIRLTQSAYYKRFRRIYCKFFALKRLIIQKKQYLCISICT